jgi:hypothetical protein
MNRACRLAVGEWITDAPPSVLERLGVQPAPLFPKRCRPALVPVSRSSCTWSWTVTLTMAGWATTNATIRQV